MVRNIIIIPILNYKLLQIDLEKWEAKFCHPHGADQVHINLSLNLDFWMKVIIGGSPMTLEKNDCGTWPQVCQSNSPQTHTWVTKCDNPGTDAAFLIWIFAQLRRNCALIVKKTHPSIVDKAIEALLPHRQVLLNVFQSCRHMRLFPHIHVHLCDGNYDDCDNSIDDL